MVSSSATKCFLLWDLEPNSHQTGRYVSTGWWCWCWCCCYCFMYVHMCCGHRYMLYVCTWRTTREKGGVVVGKLTVKASPVYYMHFTHRHTDKTVSIIHAYSHDYATVNPSVLPWHWADEKDKGEKAVNRGREREKERERGTEGEGGREKVWEKWTLFTTIFYSVVKD